MSTYPPKPVGITEEDARHYNAAYKEYSDKSFAEIYDTDVAGEVAAFAAKGGVGGLGREIWAQERTKTEKEKFEALSTRNKMKQLDKVRPTGSRLTPITIDEARVCVAQIASKLGNDGSLFKQLLKLAHMRCVIVNRMAQYCWPKFPSIVEWAILRKMRMSKRFAGDNLMTSCLMENTDPAAIKRGEPKYKAICFPCGTYLPGRRPKSVWVNHRGCKDMGPLKWHNCTECNMTGVGLSLCKQTLEQLESMDTEKTTREYWMDMGNAAAEWGQAMETADARQAWFNTVEKPLIRKRRAKREGVKGRKGLYGKEHLEAWAEHAQVTNIAGGDARRMMGRLQRLTAEPEHGDRGEGREVFESPDYDHDAFEAFEEARREDPFEVYSDEPGDVGDDESDEDDEKG